MKIIILALVFIGMSLEGAHAQENAKHTKKFSERIQTLCAGQYNRRYEQAISEGELDLPDQEIPDDIKNNARFCAFYRAGYIPGLRSYLTASGLKEGEGLGIYENLYRAESHWELNGFLADCKSAHAVGDRIMSKIQSRVTALYAKTLSLDVTIAELEKEFAETQR